MKSEFSDGLGGVSSPCETPISRKYDIEDVVIGENVWIGQGVVINPGVEIGDGAIIGANSVVTHSIPKECIAVGAPARVIKKYNPKYGLIR